MGPSGVRFESSERGGYESITVEHHGWELNQRALRNRRNGGVSSARPTVGYVTHWKLRHELVAGQFRYSGITIALKQ